MIEGLWIVKFLAPNDPEMDLNGGVVVIETGRLFGGDSGYFYIGEVGERSARSWPIKLRINRHDPGIISVFGDIDTFDLMGAFEAKGEDAQGRSIILATLSGGQGNNLIAQLTKVSELP